MSGKDPHPDQQINHDSVTGVTPSPFGGSQMSGNVRIEALMTFLRLPDKTQSAILQAIGALIDAGEDQ